MPFLTIFRGSFVSSLRANIESNLDKYLRNDKWVTEIGHKSVRDLETRIEIKGPFDLDEPDSDNLKDLENAIRVHKLLQHLTPLQARDPRLWTRLAHVECWQYMRKRWPLERFGHDPDKGARFITSRYFIVQNDSRALLRNGMARLWWTAYMSHDATRNNPYELTGVLLHTLDITQQILERNIGRSPVILRGFLEFLLQNRAQLLVGGDQNRTRIRKLAMGLNLYGGVCLLDSLTQMEILKILGTELQRILNAEKKTAKVKA
jgi:hypothetical protein